LSEQFIKSGKKSLNFKDKLDKNKILKKFSSTFFIDEEKMKNYFQDNNLENFAETLKEFENMRNNTFNVIWNKSEYSQFTNKEIENLSEKYLKENHAWIDEEGIKAVNNYLLWMCWHEGILKK
jgi:Glu-tRNA(Gln) amidotransferase subunit E-like FAD-binding protein